ncbi:MAG: 16S rRNA (adenine(1518)-N(6)/adenine(1519)-N(6))-dimethyltransferase RsmA [bacterium]
MELEGSEYTYSTKPKKSLGQYYLRDKGILKKLLDSLGLTGSETVLEIGAGHGELTYHIAQRGKEVWAVELDRENIQILKERLKNFSNVHIIEGNILNFCSDVSFDLIVGNIPYYLSGMLLGSLSERWIYRKVILTVQKEVGKRLSALPGTKSYGVLTLAVWYNHIVRILFDIPKDCFYPVPKVDSVVVELNRVDNREIEKSFFMRIVRAAFNSRRKMLPNVLTSLGLGRDYIIGLLKEMGINPQRRGETLSLEEFLSLGKRLYEAFIFSEA